MTLMPLKKETEAAQTLIVHLRALHLADDEAATHDAIEGETDLFEALGEAVKQTGADEAAIKGLKDYQQTLRARCERLKSRIEAARAAIAAALDAAGLKKSETPYGTVSLSAAKPKAIIIEEADVPARFWITPPPVQPDPYIDQKALLEALLACPPGQSIAGAQLANGGFVVTIRRR
ncbi:MAG: siphovirus Gp157 family protein [Rhodomicrobium sp.]